MDIDGDVWFPIVGNLILRDGKPIGSIPDNADAYGVVEALAKCNKGVRYTCISKDGWYDELVKDGGNGIQQAD